MSKLLGHFMLTGFALVLLGLSPNTKAGVSIGISVDSDGIKSFYIAIGEHYQVQEKEIIVLRKKNIPNEEMPVVFFLAEQIDVAPGIIIALRLKGHSWQDISKHFGLKPDIFFVNLKENHGPPYGKAYGHHKKNKKHGWKKTKLSDSDIISFVNLRFISEHYGYSPDEVVKLHSEGHNFVTINEKVKQFKANKRKALAEKKSRKEDKAQKHEQKNNGNEEKKSKGKGKG